MGKSFLLCMPEVGSARMLSTMVNEIRENIAITADVSFLDNFCDIDKGTQDSRQLIMLSLQKNGILWYDM